MSATLQAAVHLGNDSVETKIETVVQCDGKVDQGSERITRNIRDQLKDNFATDKAVQLSNAKTYVFSDSVLCMGRISENPVKGMEGERRVVYEFIPMSRIGSNRRGADGVRVKKTQDSPHCKSSPRSRT